MKNLRKFATQLKLWCLDDWEAKIVALILASLLWYVVKDKVARDKIIKLPDGWKTNATAAR